MAGCSVYATTSNAKQIKTRSVLLPSGNRKLASLDITKKKVRSELTWTITSVTMGLCKIAGAISVVLVAMLAGWLWDHRDADCKADSILFVKQPFDQRFDLPDSSTAGGALARVCFFDLPTGHAEGTARPILFLIHGKASNADDMKTLFGDAAVARARREGFVVVYPVGVMTDGTRTWNAGSVDAHNNADDVGYFSHVVDHLAANFNADPQSVFLGGMSNGGFMANRLACAWAAATQHIRLRAIAPVLGGLAKMKYDGTCGGEAVKMGGVPIPPLRVFDQHACPYDTWKQAPAHFECQAVKDLPVLIVNHGKDVLVPLSGVINTGDDELYPPVEYTLRFYAEANGCTYAGSAGRTETFRRVSDVDLEDVTTCHSLSNCRANTTLCVSHKSGHNWVGPTNGDVPVMPSRFFKWLMSPYAKTMDTNHELLSFFAQHRD